MTYGTLISTVTVGAGGASSIDFNSISSSFTDLLLVVSAKPSSGGLGYMLMNLNGSSANFTYRGLEGNGFMASSASAALSRVGVIPDSGWTTPAFSNTQIYISNYAGSTNKAISADSIQENNSSTTYADLFAVLWSNTAAVTSLSVYAATGGNWMQYSTASLYGIK